MIVSVLHRFVFLSVPKCASRAIVREIGPDADLVAGRRSELRHTPYRDLERFVFPLLETRVGLDRDDFTVLCLFREPIEWLHSWYRYRSRRALASPDHRRHARYTGEMSFEEFALAWLGDPVPEFARVGSQAEYVDTDAGLGPDEVFRFEDLGRALARIRELTGRRVRPRKVGVSPKRPLMLSVETRAALERALARDYQIYRGVG